MTPEPLLTAKDVRRILNCSLPLVYRLAECGQLRCVRWECMGNGKKPRTMIRFKQGDVMGFIADHYGSTT